MHVDIKNMKCSGTLIAIALLIFLASCATVNINLNVKSANELKNAIFLEHAIETDESPEKLFFLLSHLDKYYLKLHKGHRKFEVRDNQQFGVGAMIDDGEEVGGQYVTHVYRIEEVVANRYIKIVSKRSIVKTKGFEFPTTVIVEFKIDKTAKGKVLLYSSIAIGFDNAFMKLVAKLFGTEGIWQEHLEEELSGGKEVIKSEDFLEYYAKQIPQIIP